MQFIVGRNGVDISTWQDSDQIVGHIDFTKLAEYASFNIIKAGQANYFDPDFERNWAGSIAAGIPTGTYWFCDKDFDPKLQAQLWWDAIKNKDYQKGMHFADFEEGAWTDWKKLYDFLVEFKRLSGLPYHKIGIYTGYYFWVQHQPATIAQKKWFGQFPLFLAAYISDFSRIPFIKVPTDTWATAIILQHNTLPIGEAVGVESKEIDGDIWNDMFDFNHYWSVVTPSPNPEPEPEEPSEGGDVGTRYTLKVVSSFLNGRSSANGTVTLHSYFKNGDTLVSEERVFNQATNMYWYKILRGTRNGQVLNIPQPTWAGAGATNGYMTILTQEQIADPTPTNPVEPVEVIYIAFEAGGTLYKYVLQRE